MPYSLDDQNQQGQSIPAVSSKNPKLLSRVQATKKPISMMTVIMKTHY